MWRTILFTTTIILLNINFGSFEEASSYSNHFRGSQQGYHYPKKFARYESRSNEIVAEDPLHKVLSEIKKEQNLKSATSYDNRGIFFNRNKTTAREESSEPEFSYNENDRYGPSRWKDINATCGGDMQSPIKIDTNNVEIRENAEPLVIEGVDLVPQSMKVENDGHSLKLTFKYQDNQKINLTGGPLKNPFILDNIHFHWGNNTNGSEHVINDIQYAAELHMVTYSSLFETIGMASADPKGLAVLGVLYKYDNLNTEKDNPWVKYITKVIKAHSTYTETKYTFPIRDILKDVDFRGLLSYRGSLTTPNCTENVLWMLSTNPIPIKRNELYELRKLRNDKGRKLLMTYRPTQPLNGRTVTAYKY